MRSIRPWATAVAALALILAPLTPLAAVRAQGAQTLLKVSYDPTRELWRDINASFIPLYEKQSGTKLTIRQSHAGSSSQARAVVDGLEADVVTIASIIDTDAIAKRGLIRGHARANGAQQA